jgi:hypothetical protein
MTAVPVLTQERLREVLHYEPSTGLFTRNCSIAGAVKGSVAGCKMQLGYITISIDKQAYLAHRLAWLYMTGAWPSQYIDHINGEPSDNAWNNLREATQTQQNANMRLRKDNTSGYRGVKWNKNRQKWHATIQKDGKARHLGAFESKEDAYAVYASAAKVAFGEYFTAQT